MTSLLLDPQISDAAVPPAEPRTTTALDTCSLLRTILVDGGRREISRRLLAGGAVDASAQLPGPKASAILVHADPSGSVVLEHRGYWPADEAALRLVLHENDDGTTRVSMVRPHQMGRIAGLLALVVASGLLSALVLGPSMLPATLVAVLAVVAITVRSRASRRLEAFTWKCLAPIERAALPPGYRR
jgi:hypothetical protein